MRRLLLRSLVLILLVADLTAQAPLRETVFQRVCRWLRLNPEIYSRLATRGGGVEPAGERLVLGDLQARRINVLWACGECWSPILLSERAVAVAKSDGIWRVPLDGSTPRRILSGNNIALLVGVDPRDSEQVLVLVVDGGGSLATYTPKLANLRSGGLVAPPQELAGTFRTEDLAALPRPDALHDDRLLSTSEDSPLRMLVATFTSSPTPTFGDNEELLPWAPATAGVERFRPIWVAANSVVFLERG